MATPQCLWGGFFLFPLERKPIVKAHNATRYTVIAYRFFCFVLRKKGVHHGNYYSKNLVREKLRILRSWGKYSHNRVEAYHKKTVCN